MEVCSASRSASFTPGEKVPGTRWIKSGGLCGRSGEQENLQQPGIEHRTSSHFAQWPLSADFFLLCGLSPQANYNTDRATAACRRS
jgi:hypothetical protein